LLVKSRVPSLALDPRNVGWIAIKVIIVLFSLGRESSPMSRRRGEMGIGDLLRLAALICAGRLCFSLPCCVLLRWLLP
jgi:hypothetical protein